MSECGTVQQLGIVLVILKKGGLICVTVACKKGLECDFEVMKKIF